MQGHDVTVLSLDKPSGHAARWINTNRDAPLSRTLSRLTFDSVIDNIAFRAYQVNSLIDALRGKVNRYVLTSSVDIYCNQKAKYCDELENEQLEPFLHSDALPPWEAYLRGKRACEIALRSSPHFEKVVVRPAVVLGARDNIMCPRGTLTSRSLFFPLRIADGGPILLRHSDTRLHQVVDVGDVARALLLAATHPLAAGQVLNVVGDDVWTNERLIHSLSNSIGCKTDVLRVSDAQLKAAGLGHYQTPYFRSYMHSWFLFSNRRLKELGWRPVSAYLNFDAQTADSKKIRLRNSWQSERRRLKRNELKTPPDFMACRARITDSYGRDSIEREITDFRSQFRSPRGPWDTNSALS
jgi:nucleoside-diphosphate-sugar epimerase